MHSSSYFPTLEVIYTTAVAHVPARLPARWFVSVCSRPSAPFLGLVVISRRIGMSPSVPDDEILSSSSAESSELPEARQPVELPGASPASHSKRRCSSWCSGCEKALWHFEGRWGSSKCNRCYNKDKGGPECARCRNGLWKCELEFWSGLCCECFPLKCSRCRKKLTPVEVRWRNGCCDRCYNLWKQTTPPCMRCNCGLLQPEMSGGSSICFPCRGGTGRL